MQKMDKQSLLVIILCALQQFKIDEAAQVRIRNCNDGLLKSPTEESSFLHDITIFCEVKGFLQELSLTAEFAGDVNVTVGALEKCEFHTICSMKTIQHEEISIGGLCTYYGDSLKGCMFYMNNVSRQPQHQWPRAVGCSSQNGAAKAFCNISVTYPAEFSPCFSELTASNWTVVVRCYFKDLSHLHGNMCTLYLDLNDRDALGQSPVTRLTPGNMANDKHQGASWMCSMVHSLPLYQAATYRYVVQVDSGVRYLTNSIIIERPRGLRTSCPQYVREGGDLNCSCIIDTPGNPPGYASWDRWRATLLETGVQRRHDGAVSDVCRLYWLSSVGILPLKEQITYTLRVAYPPELPPEIEGFKNDEDVRPGDRLILTCNVTGGSPLVSSVNFTCGHHKDEEDIVSGSSVSSVVTMDPVTAKDNGIRCRCTARWLPEITLYSQPEEVVLNVINDAPAPCTLAIVIASSVVGIIFSLALAAACACLARSGERSGVYERPCPSGGSAGLFDYSTYTARTQLTSSTQDMEPIYEEVRELLHDSPQKTRDEAAVENKLLTIPQSPNEAMESCEVLDVKLAANSRSHSPSDYLRPL